MLRKSFVIISIMLFAVSACGGSGETGPAGALGTAVGAAAATPGVPGVSATPASCPTAATRRFARARFVVNAGLAAGAFKRYVYTPYRHGAFNNGARGRRKAIAKAAAAAAFTLGQLRRARRNVHADPTLCRALTGPVGRLTVASKDLERRLKKGKADPIRIRSVAEGIIGFETDSADAGAAFKEKRPPTGSVGG